MGHGSGVLRALFAAGVVVGVIWCLTVGILANHATTMMKRTAVQQPRTVQPWNWLREMHHHHHHHHNHRDFDFHYDSKRRVPNGPDPIHNRRASTSRQPPGRS